ncbi:cytidylyltransferase domain-containing protein [Natronogracilivirga saccharolytica]|uniref:Acylneuraminate cytidylyltransferase family protein n=1 Tax=Natronogracilivirga saccharolytica TaxID=2812953 RepID=A0A8J7UWR2_9BACT|nr:acylneuraminate cytidylyltransferase family protein [Natronogracilivirga saccharolytica]MBP3193951.1 acylneuraminate cytidylyltransferase family protein [Natronogracilivirga saccharolytica]
MSRNIIAIIPARGGSKGVPGKNLKPLAGMPLIDHTLSFAVRSNVFDRIVLTSDDEKICERAEEHGVQVIKRPEHLAGDNSLVVDAMVHVLDELAKEPYEPELIFLLEPTAPVRDRGELVEAISALEDGYDSVASFCETNPPASRIWLRSEDGVQPLMPGADPFLPRQQQVPGYRLTGQYYGFKKHLFSGKITKLPLSGRIYPLITDAESVVDIDREIDFFIAEQVLKMRESQKAGK